MSEENNPAPNSPAKNSKGFSGITDAFKEWFTPHEKVLNKHIRVILNPASGQDEPALKVFNKVFHDAGYSWDIRITQKAGDGTNLAKAAIAEGVDVIVVYGGDGSVMEAAAGMLGSNIPMGVIPGGTGNVIALSLGIPHDATEACNLIVAKNRPIKTVDVGMAGETHFLERIGVGLEATVTEKADREAKNKYGIFAYLISTVQALSEPQIVKYGLDIDGQHIDTEGLSCVVANIGDLGVGGLSLAPDVDISDGLLDIFVIRKGDLVSLFSLAADVIGRSENSNAMPHWKGREIQITANPSQAVQADGELIGNAPINVKLLPGALKVIALPKDTKATKTTAPAEANLAKDAIKPQSSS